MTRPLQTMTLAAYIAQGGATGPRAFSYGAGRFVEAIRSSLRYPEQLNQNRAAPLYVRLLRKIQADLNIPLIEVATPRTASHFNWCFDKNDYPIQLSTISALWRHIRQAPEASVSVLTGLSDDEIDQAFLDDLPKAVAKVYANNIDLEDPRLCWVPIGRDPGGVAYYDIPASADKPNLVWANFSAQTHPIRARVMENLAQLPFVTNDVQAQYGAYVGYRFTQQEFYERLNSFQFALCPRGNGVDTYRLWDSLSLGVIPIVVREAAFHDKMQGLPIYWLSSYDDIIDLTEERLSAFRADAMERVWDFSMLDADYWLAQLPLEVQPVETAPAAVLA